jgi:hypothetical protein
VISHIDIDLVWPQGGVHLEVLDTQDLFLVFWADVPQFHGEILLVF